MHLRLLLMIKNVKRRVLLGRLLLGGVLVRKRLLRELRMEVKHRVVRKCYRKISLSWEK
jgi:hypothetical protein